MTQLAATTRPWRSALRTAIVAWLWLAWLWTVSSQLTVLPPWAWLLAVVTLLALPAWGMWLALMLRKKLRRLQFAADGHLVRWLAGGWWPACKALASAGLLCAVTLWQAWFLSAWEWGLLALAPALYVLVSAGLQSRLVAEFASPGWAWAWSQRGARWLLVLLLGGLWLYGLARSSDWGRALQPGMAPAVLDAALAQIQAAPSGIVRWGLDSLLTLQVAGGVLADLPQGPALRLVLLALCGPVGVLLCLGHMLQGAASTRVVVQHALPTARTTSGSNQSAATAWLLGLVGVLLASVLVQTTAQVDAQLRTHTNPLALQRMPECERIGQQLYRIGTLEATRQIALQALGQMQALPALCTGLQNAQHEMDAAVERYLDWYFSLGAEWGRLLRMLTGDVGGFLQDKLAETLSGTPGLAALLEQAQQQTERNNAAMQTAQQRMAQTLERHHLALDAGQCLLRSEVAELPAVQLLGQAQQRLTASAIAGTGAGAFAAVVAGKAMAKTSMKAASKVLAKAAAKQGLGKAGAAVAGAALGSVVPGIGTAAGAIAGAVAGAVVGVGIDWAALYAEEHLTRHAMRDDLRAALNEQMQALGAAWSCDAGAKPQP